MQHPCCQGNSPVGSRKQAEPGLSSLLQQPPEQQRGQCASIAQAAVPESEQVSASSFTETTAFHGKQLTNSPGHSAAPAAVSQSGWWFPAAQAHVWHGETCHPSRPLLIRSVKLTGGQHTLCSVLPVQPPAAPGMSKRAAELSAQPNIYSSGYF